MNKRLMTAMMAVCGCMLFAPAVDGALTWTETATTYDGYLEAVGRLEKEVREGDPASHGDQGPSLEAVDDYYPGIPPVADPGRIRRTQRDDTSHPAVPRRDPVADDIEILKAQSLQERRLIEKYNSRNPFDSRLEVFPNQKNQWGEAQNETQALIEQYHVPDQPDRIQDERRPWKRIQDRDPLEDRDLIEKYNRTGTPNPGDKDDWKLVEQDPLEERDLIEKYNRIGTPNPRDRDDWKLMEQDPLEDRDLIEKYNRTGTPNPRDRDDWKLMEQDPLEDRDLIEKYDRRSQTSSGVRRYARRDDRYVRNDPVDTRYARRKADRVDQERQTIDDKDLVQDDAHMGLSLDEGPPYLRESPLAGLEMSVEAFEYVYEEPNYMKLKGYTYGLLARYTRRLYRNIPLHSWRDVFGSGNGINFIQLEARGSWGLLDYTSEGSGTNDNENHYTAEIRGVLGYDIPMPKDIIVTPFIGLGYRYLYDDSGGETTSTGHYTYDRESQYFYAPIGLEAAKYFGQSWRLALTAEYDVFIRGTQTSHLEDASSNYSTLENDQHDGQGFRGSVKLTKSTSAIDFYLEPFYRYWHIEDSDVASVSYSGVTVGYGLEPENDTHEYGIKMGMEY